MHEYNLFSTTYMSSIIHLIIIQQMCGTWNFEKQFTVYLQVQ